MVFVPARKIHYPPLAPLVLALIEHCSGGAADLVFLSPLNVHVLMTHVHDLFEKVHPAFRFNIEKN